MGLFVLWLLLLLAVGPWLLLAFGLAVLIGKGIRLAEARRYGPDAPDTEPMTAQPPPPARRRQECPCL